MTFGTVASVVGIVGGINALFGGGDSGGGTQVSGTAQQAVDPFAPYRANLGAMYSGMLQPGVQTDVTKMPGYSQFKTGVLDPALEASKRTASASGMLRSGNEQLALDKTSQQGYYGFMQDYMNRLATGSGAGYSPATGGQAGITTAQQQQQAQMQGVGGIVQGIGQIYNSSGSGYTMSDPNVHYGTTGMSADQLGSYVPF